MLQSPGRTGMPSGAAVPAADREDATTQALQMENAQLNAQVAEQAATIAELKRRADGSI